MSTLLQKSRFFAARNPHIEVGFAAIAILSIASGCGSASHTVAGSVTVSATRFQQVNLVADTPGIAAHTDPNLVNPWGISFSPTGTFWFSDNGTGLSTLYDGAGNPESLVVTIPAAAASGAAATGTPSGTVFTGGMGFSGSPAFAFVSEDGVLTTWKGGTNATISADLSASGAVFKGLALATLNGATNMYATDFHNGKIVVFNSSYQQITLAGSFSDAAIPAGFAPFGIQNIGGSLYVTYAAQDSDKHDDAAGPGNGFVDVFAPDGTLVHHLISRGNLNSPWGLALAPAGFGPYGGDLLVGNFGDGAINVFDPVAGAYIARLANSNGTALSIPNLWGLAFGNGGSGGSANLLYFTSGPGGESHGLYGSLQPE